MQALVATHTPDNPVELRTVAEPSPAADEAIIAVRAFSINRGELSLLAARPEGWRPGQDISGVVVQAAADGSGPAVGTRVVALVDQAGWAERVAAPVSRIASLPDGVTFTAAATLPVAGLTALRALRVGGSLLGKHVLITGASGGVGQFAVQIAAQAGAYVTARVSSAERGAGLRALGADAVVTTLDGMTERFDHILESVGGQSLSDDIKVVAEDGTIAVFGNTSREPTTLNFGDFGGHARAKIFAFFVYQSGDRPTFSEDLAYLARLVGTGKLQPQIGAESDWRDLPRVIEALRNRQIAGKAVGRIGEQ